MWLESGGRVEALPGNRAERAAKADMRGNRIDKMDL
jgi:hypothetical protein